MAILICSLFVITILVLLTAIVFLFTPLYPYSIAVFVLGAILDLLALTLFYKYIAKSIDKQKEKLLIRIKNRVYDSDTIVFEKKNGKWICEKDSDIAFDLNGYLFQKSFITAWITRNIRYSTVSNRLKLIKLLSFRLKVKSHKNLRVSFINGTKRKDYCLVKNYVSRHTILTRAINKSKYHERFGRYTFNYMKRVHTVNEKIYLEEGRHHLSLFNLFCNR